MALSNLPPEILLMIADHLNSQSDMNSLARANKNVWEVVNLHVYRYNIAHNKGEGLNWAAVHNQSCSAQYFIDAGVHRMITRWYQMPLILASKLGSVPVLSTLLRAGASPNYDHRHHLHEYQVNKLGNHFAQQSQCYAASPLSIAASKGFEIAAKLLIHHGADVNFGTQNGTGTALHAAALNGHSSIISLLLQHGADTEVTASTQVVSNIRPVECALRFRHPDAFRVLIAKGNKVHASFLLEVIQASRPHAFVLAILESDPEIDVNYQDIQKNGLTPLHAAGTSGTAETVKALIERGANLEAKDNYGRTPLYLSVMRCNKDVVFLLLELGADTTNTDFKCNTLLHRVADRRREPTAWKKQIAESLIERGADIEARNKYQETPLFHAAKNSSTAIASLLIEKGADVEARNRRGETCLFSAVRKESTEIVRLLIRNGCDATEKNSQGLNVMKIASQPTNSQVGSLRRASIRSQLWNAL